LVSFYFCYLNINYYWHNLDIITRTKTDSLQRTKRTPKFILGLIYWKACDLCTEIYLNSAHHNQSASCGRDINTCKSINVCYICNQYCRTHYPTNSTNYFYSGFNVTYSEHLLWCFFASCNSNEPLQVLRLKCFVFMWWEYQTKILITVYYCHKVPRANIKS
jgi:hypothetical protein